ncbi:unnamed protein product [Adineta steineri]|uniref:Uncharacterized protein n=1 Tax=Adineta steineri TaxID=433720 RepID=A0A813NJW0_9BILA|nr:unnamed protein product [Adineta steineri]CAF0750866.1 unnamed protein product [Adineta steineri]
MIFRKTYLFVLFVVCLFQLVTTQNDDDTTTPSPICESGKFPLFGNKSCISQELYTIIFLASIILAGISFIMLIGLIILTCRKNSGSSESGNSDRYSISSTSTQEVPSMSREKKQKVEALGKVVGTTPLEDTRHKRVVPPTNDYYDITDTRTPASAPYTSSKPISKRTPGTDIHEMTPRQANRPPTHMSQFQPVAPPRRADNQAGRSGNKRNNDYYRDDNKISSQF